MTSSSSPLSPYLCRSSFGKENFFLFRKLSTKILIPDKEGFGFILN